MARDDRERNFEDALARNLQANLPVNASVGTPASAPALQKHCPDAEILAAYHERLLAPDEMSSRKQHIASCVRCQEILAQLEITDEIPLEVDRKESVSRNTVAVPDVELVPAAAASAIPAVQAAVAKFSSPTSPMERPRRSYIWRWLVPSAALAAGLLIWVTIHERTSQETEFQLAKNQPQPPPEVLPAAPPPPADSAIDKLATNELQVPPAAKSGQPAKTDAFDRGQSGTRDQKVPAPSAVPKLIAPSGHVRPNSSVTSQERSAMQSRILAQSPFQAKQVAGDAAAQPALSATSAAPDAVADRVSPVPTATPEAKKEGVAGGVAGAAAPAVTLEQSQTTRSGALALRESANLRASRSPVLVSSPNGTVVWRLLPAGIVEGSADAGANWSLQQTPVVADMLAGSAPSNKICWIVGRSGAILRTTDGGKHWLKLSSPTTDDITAVFAADTDQAIVTTSTDKSYRTTDGGTSWTPQPNP
jgi:Photosynthesis system II assembly factor YCF48